MLLPYSTRLRAANVQIVLASTSPRRRELMGLLFPAERQSATAGTQAAAVPSVSSASSAASLSVPFRCVPSTFAEDLPHSSFPSAAAYACATSMAKAREVWARLHSSADSGSGSPQHPPCHVLIAADTVVVRDGAILEKPSSPAHAIEMLSSLVGRTHQVVTGCSLLFQPDSSEQAGTQPSSNSSAASSSAATAAAAAGSHSTALEVSFSVSSSVTFADSSVLSDDVIRAYVASGEPFDKAGGYGYQSLAATFVTRVEGCYWNVVGFPLHELAVHLKPHIERVLKQLEQQQ